ncbi:lipoprotein [Candidatus Magnetobacterium casense]
MRNTLQKALQAVLIVTLSLSLCACGKKGPPTLKNKEKSESPVRQSTD